MKIHRFIFSAAIASIGTTAVAEPPAVKYDRFEQKTDITAKTTHTTGTATGPLEIQTLVHLLGATIKEGKQTEFNLMIAVIGSHWHYLQCHDVHFLVDDKPYTELGQGKFASQMQGAATEEVWFFPLTREMLARLSSAERIEYKLCNDEKVFDAQDRAMLKDFGPALDDALKGGSGKSR